MLEKKDNIVEIKIENIKNIIDEIESKSDSLVFTEEDIVAVQDPLTILFRTIIYNKQITTQQFKELVRDYYVRIGANAKQISQQPNNILRNIKANREITAKMFKLVLGSILQMVIKKFDVTFLNYNELDENDNPKEERYVVNVVNKQ